MKSRYLVSDIPWYFRPLPYIAIFIAANVAMVFGYVSAEESSRHLFETALWALASLLFLSWPYLLYEYLAPSAHGDTRDRPGRCNFLYALLTISIATVIVFDALGWSHPEPNEPTDLMVLPIFYAYLTTMWRASNLLVELERRRSSGTAPSVFLTFIAIFYLVFGIVWIAARLRKLKRAGVI